MASRASKSKLKNVLKTARDVKKKTLVKLNDVSALASPLPALSAQKLVTVDDSLRWLNTFDDSESTGYSMTDSFDYKRDSGLARGLVMHPTSTKRCLVRSGTVHWRLLLVSWISSLVIR